MSKGQLQQSALSNFQVSLCNCLGCEISVTLELLNTPRPIYTHWRSSASLMDMETI